MTPLARRAALLLSLGLGLGGCATVTVSEKNFLQPDLRPPAAEALGAGYVVDSVAVTQADGAVSRGIHVRHPDAIATVLYFGGSNFRLDREGRPVVQNLVKAGVDVLIFDYRGYGRSDGQPSVESLRSDAAALFRFARERSPGRVVVHGLSMGSFVAASVAATQPVDGLVLEGAPLSAEALVWNGIPWYARPFVRLQLDEGLRPVDSVQLLGRYAGPLLALVGENDAQVPPAMQRALFEQIPSSRKTLRVFPGYGHKGLIESPDFPGVLRGFISAQAGI